MMVMHADRWFLLRLSLANVNTQELLKRMCKNSLIRVILITELWICPTPTQCSPHRRSVQKRLMRSNVGFIWNHPLDKKNHTICCISGISDESVWSFFEQFKWIRLYRSRSPNDLLHSGLINYARIRNSFMMFDTLNALYPNYFSSFFLFHCCYKILNANLSPIFFKESDISGVITIRAALVTGSHVISQLVYHSPDASTASEII